MENSTSKCPSCKSTEMLRGGIHGMEHMVCTKCGTVLENDQFTVDVFEGGSKEVKADFDGRPSHYGFLINNKCSQNSRSHRDGLVMLRRLMDGLDLPASVRDTAMHYFKYTKSLNKLASAGAVVYLAMKDSHMPVTIRCIANYLQVSHYAIGRVMRALEKKIGHKRTHGATFEVNELIPHLFSQAQFGVEEEKKRMLELIMKKTDELLCLLKECMATTGYSPHLIAIAAGFIVWKHLNIAKWSELNLEVDKLPMRPVGVLTISLFLSEIGILLPSQGMLISKISLIKNVLCQLSKQIPWLSISEPSKVIIHLNDILKYKSQIIDMTAKELADDKKDFNKEVSVSTQGEGDVKSENSGGDSLLTEVKAEDGTSGISEGIHQATSSSNSKQACPSEEENLPERNEKTSGGRSFIRVTDLQLSLQKSSEAVNEPYNNKRRAESKEREEFGSNGYDKLLRISHPNIGKKKKEEAISQS